MDLLAIIIAAIVALGPSPASALKIKTSEFAQMCAGEAAETMEQEINRVICLSYLQGVIDTHAAMITLFPQAVLFCPPPPGIALESARLLFLAWAEEHAEDRHRPADITVISALNAALPCAK